MSHPCMFVSIAGGLTAAMAISTSVMAGGEIVTLEPIADTTIFSIGGTSNGAGPDLFAGVTGNPGGATIQRSPVEFDVAAAGIPGDATITSVSLQFTVTQSSPIAPPMDPYTLHRMSLSWGEAGAVAEGGQGAPADANDATWADRFFPATQWNMPGGDFVSTPSAMTMVPNQQGSIITFTSPSMISDVEAWLLNPLANHGWILIGNEAAIWNARKFGSRENGVPSRRPQLVIEYTAGADCVGDFDGSGAINFADVLSLLSVYGPCVGCEQDLDGDDEVGFGDLLTLLSNFGGCVE